MSRDTGEQAQPHRDVAAFYDAGELSCGDLMIAMLKAMRPLQPGEVLEVRALDPGAVLDIPAWCRLRGHTLLAGPSGPDKVHYFIQRGGKL